MHQHSVRRALVALGWLALIAVSAPALAGVEFVTPEFHCRKKVDTAMDGKSLFVIADQDVRFEVWGDALDLSNPSTGFRIATDAGSGNVSARLVAQRSPAQNRARGCAAVASALVEMDTAATTTSTLQRSLYFMLPRGEESRLQVTVKPWPTFTATWQSPQAQSGNLPCRTDARGATRLEAFDKRLVIDLPVHPDPGPGTCDAWLVPVIRPADTGELDIQVRRTYSAIGLPAFIAAVAGGPARPAEGPALKFRIDAAGIRDLVTTSNSTITIRGPNTNRTADLDLQVNPATSCGFTGPRAATSSTIVAGGTIELRLHKSCAGPISWRVRTAACFMPQGARARGNRLPMAVHVLQPTPGQATMTIRLQSLGGAACASAQGVEHVFEAWIGDAQRNPDITQPTTGSTYFRSSITLRTPATSTATAAGA